MTHQEEPTKKSCPVTSRAAMTHRFEGTPKINTSKLALLITFLHITVKGKKHYCEPHPNTLLELLEKYHNITIQRRWLFQCLLDLETAGLIRRQRRWLKVHDNEIRSTSSLWWFTIRGAKYLARKSIRGAQELLRSMLTWLHRGDDRRPTYKDIAEINAPTTREEALKRLHKLIADIG